MIGRSRLLACLIAVAALSAACGKPSGSSSEDQSKAPALANISASVGGSSGGGSSGGTASSGGASSGTTGSGSSDLVAETAVGLVQAACQQNSWQAQLKLNVAVPGQTAALSADLQADPSPGHRTAHITDSAGLEEELVDGTDYLRQGTSKWFKVSAASVPAALLRPPCSEFGVLRFPNLTAVQELPDQAAGSTHHYRFQADAYTLISASLLISPTALTAFKAHPAQVTADLYTDDTGRPLRYETGTASVADGAGPATMKLTETFSAFGTPLTLVAPDPSQVSDQPPAGLKLEVPPNPTASAAV
ncbi:hypothetical protein KGQ20_24035 [Catenulispora sp. NF23]|uniref:hypothetical protein n=1 Tax=Catenulispora pinistramenti TaxID=2705254 RepID=UPI001BAB136A|nr:hypothetical protein [Catenulispora pinistramenti]MBS2535837.1 hypothetical protein [Catenulispora pinistramenti]